MATTSSSSPRHITSDSLYSRLAAVLPAGSSFNFYHVSTPPTKGDPLFAPAPGERQQRTYCESQTLAVSIVPPGGSEGEEVLVYAIEVLLYTTKTLTTLFVSKADSTGYLNLLKSDRPSAGSAIRTITSTFISWLAENRQRPGVRFVVSLFARAQDQYLFPGSVENPGKHVLDDRQLVKWWCKTLDPVLRRRRPERDADGDEPTAQGYVIVPGFDKHETSSFFPPTWRDDPPEARKWQYGHPLREIAPNPTAPPRCLVPHFPDDPKARYLDELDGEIPDLASSQTLFSPSKRGRGMWKSIKTLEQFWETMAFRQECSSGRLVGFVWLVFTPPDPLVESQNDSFDSQRSASPLLDRSRELTRASSPRSDPSDTTNRPRRRPRRKKLTGPIVTRMPKIKSSTSHHSIESQSEESPYYRWSQHGRGQVVVDYAAYLRVHDLLLRLDFSTLAAATRSTRKWIDEVKVMSRTVDRWGKTVAGLQVDSAMDATKTVTHNGAYVAERLVALHDSDFSRQANDISGMLVRKKRKPDTNETDISGADARPVAVNVLNNGLVRKKPKVAHP